MNLRTKRRLRWLVPSAVVAVTAGVSSVSRVLPAGADPIPVLPALTPAQLVDKVHNAQVTTLTGDISLSSHLGLPDLSAFGPRTSSLLDLLTGAHTVHVSVDGPEHVRVALDAPQAESDWIRNGTDVWSWDSQTQRVVHATLPAQAANAVDGADGQPADGDGRPQLDPATAANQLLASIDPTTSVTVRTPGYVAGRPVYELVVAPRTDRSTIGDGVISVDAATGLPLAVRVDAKATGKPAAEVKFTSISFDKPASSTFEFTPPAGSTVHRRRTVSNDKANGVVAGKANGTGVAYAATQARSKVTTIGTGWESVAIVSGLNLGGQFQALFDNSPAVTVGAHSAHLVSTSIVNVLVLDDGRIAIAAMTPDALTAAVAAQ
jgi:outer membrane lipoprotein-sorting protein